MKYAGRFVLLVLSLIISITYSIFGHIESIFLIVALIYVFISWVIGRRYDRYRFLSYHDALTSAYNRRYAYKRFDKMFERAMMKEEKISILYIDIDNFKEINDSNGHHYGDLVLKDLSRVVLRNIRNDDLLIRWGGDEFLVICMNRDEHSTRNLIDQVNKEMKEEVNKCNKDKRIDLTLSIGFSFFPDDGENVSELLSVADQRMYLVKSQSK